MEELYIIPNIHERRMERKDGDSRKRGKPLTFF